MENKCCASGSDGDKKGCCWMTIFKGALVGGLIMFAYLMASWAFFPWHKDTIMTFKNEKVVAAAISGNIHKSGLYMLPGIEKTRSGKEEVAPPFAFVSVYQKGVSRKLLQGTLFKELLFCLFAGAVLTKLLKKACGCPVFHSMKLGLFAGIFHYFPNMIWFHFPFHYSLFGLIDDFIAVTLAGLFVSRIVLNSGACTMGKSNGKKGSSCCG